MTRYFCDRCGQETSEDKLQKYKIVVPYEYYEKMGVIITDEQKGITHVTLDLCPSCIFKLGLCCASFLKGDKK